VATTQGTTIGVAIAVPDPWGAQLQEYRTALGDPSAVGIPTHITLMPPFDAGVDELAKIEEHLEDTARTRSPFRVHLRGTGTFRPVSPVVFVQVSKGISACERLERAVRSGPVERTLEFPYHPHVTIAHHLDDPALDEAFEGLADFRATFRVRTVDLYEHGEDGVWRVARTFVLGEAGRSRDADLG